MITLPAVLQTYFDSKGSDLEATLACFADSAVVWDNGEDLVLRGIDEIREWMSGRVAGYKLTSEIVSSEEQDGRLVVGVVVSGDFPGSPYKFEYGFKLAGDKIVELAIDPIGSLAG